jgi:hypothetical protein
LLTQGQYFFEREYGQRHFLAVMREITERRWPTPIVQRKSSVARETPTKGVPG